MGVWADIKALTWCIVHRAEMVEEDERTNHFPIMEGQNSPHDEAIA